MRHVFLSPHMDDAALSAGNYILKLLKERKSVFIITIFTTFGSKPISWNSQKYLLKSGCLGLRAFTKMRNREDLTAMRLLGIPFLHLDFIDGGFRKDSQNKILYPAFDNIFSGTISRQDKKNLSLVSKTITSHIKKTDVIYAPIGIGKHIDHMMVNRIAQQFPNKIYYWLDQPYAWNLNQYTETGYSEAFRVVHQKKKEKVVDCYQSQVNQLYPKGIPKIDERFYEKKSCC